MMLTFAKFFSIIYFNLLCSKWSVLLLVVYAELSFFSWRRTIWQGLFFWCAMKVTLSVQRVPYLWGARLQFPNFKCCKSWHMCSRHEILALWSFPRLVPSSTIIFPSSGQGQQDIAPTRHILCEVQMYCFAVRCIVHFKHTIFWTLVTM